MMSRFHRSPSPERLGESWFPPPHESVAARIRVFCRGRCCSSLRLLTHPSGVTSHECLEGGRPGPCGTPSNHPRRTASRGPQADADLGAGTGGRFRGGGSFLLHPKSSSISNACLFSF